MQTLKDLFRGLKPLQIADLCLFALAAVMLPYIWHLSFWFLILLLINAIVKDVQARRFGNRALSSLGKWSLLMCIAYLAICGISLLYTDNLQKGVQDLLGKSTLLFPVVAFLISDYTYLKKNHLRAILYLFSAALIVRFIVRFVYMLIALHNGAAFSSCLDAAFDPEAHHSYISMYLLLAIVFITLEMMCMPKKYMGLYVLALLPLVAYLYCFQSRAGLLCLALIAFIGLLMYVFIRKKYLFGLITFAAAVLLIAGITKFVPAVQTRLLGTVEAVIQGQRTDDRFAITDGSLYVIKENMPWGTGIGDRMDELIPAYQSLNYEKAYEHKYNPHNQFMDALMSEGILGFVVFIAMIFLPMIEAVRKRDWLLLFFIIIVIESACFESIFERQMGLIYFCLFIVLLLSPVADKQSTAELDAIPDSPSRNQ